MPLFSSLDDVLFRIPTGFVWLIPVIASFSNIAVTDDKKKRENKTIGLNFARSAEKADPTRSSGKSLKLEMVRWRWQFLSIRGGNPF